MVLGEIKEEVMFKKFSKSNLPAIAFAAAALASAHPSVAFANDDSETRTEAVYYNDLNLASPAGVKVLDRRLDRAVKRVCGTDEAFDVVTRTQSLECERETHLAVAKQRQFVIAQANSPDGKRWADNGSRNQLAVAQSE
jgi:UrcA family protein